jgi:hypothetical protein
MSVPHQVFPGINVLTFRRLKVYTYLSPIEHNFFSERVIGSELPFRKSSKPVVATDRWGRPNQIVRWWIEGGANRTASQYRSSVTAFCLPIRCHRIGLHLTTSVDLSEETPPIPFETQRLNQPPANVETQLSCP